METFEELIDITITFCQECLNLIDNIKKRKISIADRITLYINRKSLYRVLNKAYDMKSNPEYDYKMYIRLKEQIIVLKRVYDYLFDLNSQKG